MYVGIDSSGVTVVAATRGPVMVVASATPDVMVNVVVVAGGMIVVMKCEEHSSAPAGFHNTAAHCQYILLARMVGMGFIQLGVLTSVAVVFDTGPIHGPQHHSSCQDHGQRQERHDGRSICAKDSEWFEM